MLGGFWPELTNVLRNIERLQEELSSFFLPQGRVEFPAVNLYATGDSIKALIEIPGIEPDDIEISVNDNTLTISGERKAIQPEEEFEVHREERFSGKFTKVLTLPYRVEEGKIEAKYKNGFIELTLPRKEEDKPKKIKIKVEK